MRLSSIVLRPHCRTMTPVRQGAAELESCAMADISDQENLDGLLSVLRRRVAYALQQQQVLGVYTPFHIVDDLRVCREQIKRLKADLRAIGVDVEDSLEDIETADERAVRREQAQAQQRISGDYNVLASGGSTVNYTVYQGVPMPSEPQVALRVAQNILAAMPLDVVPKPASLPSSSRMPLAVNPLFVGREAELKSLAATLKDVNTTVIAAAAGIGGVGKTQLASEFAHRYGQFFAGGVFWMSFAEAGSVDAEIASCGRSMALSGLDGLELADQVMRVRQAWHDPVPRLLVFDNCEDEALLAHYRPISGGSRVLVTSRRQGWDIALGVYEHRLATLPRQQSTALLRKFRPDLAVDDAILAALCDELGDLPLALHLAGSFLKEYRQDVTPAEYLAELRAGALLEHESLQGIDVAISPTEHALDVGRTFALSYEGLRDDNTSNAMARELLARLAYFAPGEPVPRTLWLRTLKLEGKAAERRASKALRRLVDLGLADEEGDGAVRLHRLIVSFVQTLAHDEAARDAVEQTIIEAAYDINNKGYPAPLVALQTHVRYVTYEAMEREDEQAALLCSNLGYHLQHIAEYIGARPLYERALEIRERVLGPDHPNTATSLNNLALLLESQGDYQAARPLFERALEIRERVLGADHPDTATSLNNLAGLLRSQGNYQAARPLYERALEIRERVLEADHPDTATSLNNQAALLRSQGNYQAARPLYERALSIYERVLEADHPDTASTLNNLALLLNSQGDYQAARPLFERALSIYERVLGPDHPDTASTLNNLALPLESQGDYQAARPLYERALEIRERVLGPDHPNTAISLNNLALLLESQGDYQAARPLFERALEITERVLGADHPNTATSLSNLAGLLRSQGDYQAARPLFERALEITERVLGADHPNTATSLNNLALLLDSQGDYQAARPLYQRALSIYERVLGPYHLDTASTLNNLALLLDSQGDYQAARPLYQRALKIPERVLGADHPDTRSTRKRLADVIAKLAVED